MTTMTAVYDALIAGDIPSEKATAAVEAIEVARDEPWKRKTEAAHADLHTEMQAGFAQIETRIAGLEIRMETRIAGLETRMARLETRVNTVGGVIISMQIGQILLVLGWIALSS